MITLKKTMLSVLAVSLVVLGGFSSSVSAMSHKVTSTKVGHAKMYSDKDIVTNAANAPTLSTLVVAVKAADLVETLMSDGPFTVFAPDNHAFAKIDAKTLEFLLKPENKAELAKILTYHVVAGNLTVAHLKNKQVLTTVQGGTLKVTKTFKKIKGHYYSTIILTDEQGNKSKLTTRNVYQKNGVVHLIDNVLMPKVNEVKKEVMMEEKKDIVSTAVSVPTLSTLVVAVKAAGLVDTLMSKGPFTVFAPDNNAFAKIDAKTIESLLKPENKATLVKILTYHVVAGTVASKDLMDGQVITTIQGGKLIVSIKDGKVMLTDEMGGVSTVTTADLYQKNGIVHIINTVVMPK